MRRLLPLTRLALDQAGRSMADVDLVAYTQGPGLGGALLVGAAVVWREADEAQRRRWKDGAFAQGKTGIVRTVAGGALVASSYRSEVAGPVGDGGGLGGNPYAVRPR